MLQAIVELGLSTSDVSVVGYDDTDIAAHPLVSMSSVNQSGTRMGEIVVRLLLERIAGCTEAVHEVIPPRQGLKIPTRKAPPMSTAVDSLRLEYRPDTTGVARPTPRLSWVTRSELPGWRQLGAELAWDDGSLTVNFQVDGNASVLVDWPFAALKPRQQGTLRVRVQGVDGWSGWSATQPVHASFLAPGEWQALFIGLPAPTRPAQPEFDVASGLERATWYATALGVYQAEVNGRPVDDQILKPGWTPYEYRLVHETTDVTGSLKPGRNAIGVALAGGWYTESYGFLGLAKPFYGEQPSFAGQLLLEYADGSSTWIRTGPDWQASAEGPWTDAGIYNGETYDARAELPGWSGPGFAAAGWLPVAVVPSGPMPEARAAPEVRVIEQVAVTEVMTSPAGATLLDFGQNLVGRLRIRVVGDAGTTIRLRHAEVLEDGELGVRPLRVAKATDTFTLAGAGVEEWAPSFTFHGFRFAEVTGWPGAVDPSAITAEVIHWVPDHDGRDDHLGTVGLDAGGRLDQPGRDDQLQPLCPWRDR